MTHIADPGPTEGTTAQSAVRARVSKLLRNGAVVWLVCPADTPNAVLNERAITATLTALEADGRMHEARREAWVPKSGVRAAEADGAGQVHARLVLRFLG